MEKNCDKRDRESLKFEQKLERFVLRSPPSISILYIPKYSAVFLVKLVMILIEIFSKRSRFHRSSIPSYEFKTKASSITEGVIEIA